MEVRHKATWVTRWIALKDGILWEYASKDGALKAKIALYKCQLNVCERMQHYIHISCFKFYIFYSISCNFYLLIVPAGISTAGGINQSTEGESHSRLHCQFVRFSSGMIVRIQNYSERRGVRGKEE